MAGSVVRIVVGIEGAATLAGAVALLALEPDLVVVGGASTEAALVDTIRRERADVVVVDAEFGRSPTRLRDQMAGMAVVWLVPPDSPIDRLVTMAGAGTSGIVRIGAPISAIAEAVRSVNLGLAWLEPSLRSQILALASWRQRSSTRPPPTPAPRLTVREREVLALVAEGLSNGEIGERLYVSERTSKYHVSNLLRKFEARDRGHLVALSFRAGLLEEDCPAG